MRPSPKRPVTCFWNGLQRCSEALHGSVREFLGVRYFRTLESKSLVKTVVPSANVNGPQALKM